VSSTEKALSNHIFISQWTVNEANSLNEKNRATDGPLVALFLSLRRRPGQGQDQKSWG